MKLTTIKSFVAAALCAVGLAAVAADSVTYLEWNENTKRMEEKSVTDYTLVTADTATFDAGKTYVVQGEVVRDRAIMVNGTAGSPTYLILCDEAKLTVTTTGGGTVSALGNDDPGIGVKSDRALVICGQTQGTGVLDARGGRWGAGIGGRHSEAGGTVTINGGTIIAIGGGPAMNPGETDPSHGGGAGIGGGYEGKGGTVTINGGMVTAIGTAGHAMAGARACAAGIGAGGTDKVSLKDPGTLTFGSGFSGFVLVGENETCPVMMTPAEYSADHGSKYRYVKMPVADVSVPQVAGVTYVVSNGANKVSGAVVGTGEASTNHYAALPGDTLKVYFVLREGSSYTRPPAQNPMEIVVSGWQQSVSLAELPEVEATSVSYLDWDKAQQQLVPKTIRNYEFVTPDMDVLEAGKTYVVKGAVTNATDGIVVYGVDERPTTLVLCDDASLTVRGGQYLAGIAVAGVRGRDFIDHVLVICGQENGTGVLDAMGGEYAAGIGGNYSHFISPTEGTCAYVACGTVTINGGVVTATGGNTAAGIGGGSGDYAASIVGDLAEVADGGTVTINGGVVTATGGNRAAGIGGGTEGGGGTVTINGGTVAATGGAEGAGIGGGSSGAAGTVTFGQDFGDADTDGVRAGASEETAVYMPKAKYSDDHSARFVTLPEPEPVEVTIKLPKAKNCAYVVSNLTAGVEGEIFPTEEGGLSYVLPVHKKVAIYVIPDQGYRIVGENPYVIEDVKYDETIPSGVLPNAEQVPASATLVSVSPRYPWNGKVDVTVDLLNAHENNSYALALAFTANDETVCVTNNLDNAVEGHNTVTVDCTGLFPADTVAADAHVEVELIDVAAPEGEEITPFCVTAEEPNLMVGFFDNGAAFSASFGFDLGSWSCNNLEYSSDGETWQALESDGGGAYYVTLENVGDKVYFRGENPEGFSSVDLEMWTCAIGSLFAYSEEKEGNGIGMVSVSGNIMSLVDPTMEATAIPGGSGCFAGLFMPGENIGCILLSADRLRLPATTLKPACYFDMFNGQTYLTGAPELPAEELEPMCYAMMFSGCSSLRYVKMMATDIGSTEDDGCLLSWLEGAGKQSGAPIPVSGATLARNPDAEWYEQAGDAGEPEGWTVKPFEETAPCEAFCVTAEEPNLMVGFFDNGATFSASFEFGLGPWSCNNLQYSFDGETWQTLESDGGGAYYVTLENVGDKVYFRGENPEGFSSVDLEMWTCAIGSLFAYSEEKEGNGIGMVSVSGNIMSLVDPTMEATAIPGGSGCFAGLFMPGENIGCILLSADQLRLPATTLKPACYFDMFNGQTYLTGAPELPAEELEPMCYAMMFSGCSSLRYVKMMATDIGSTEDDGCLSFWLEGADGESAPIPVTGATLARNPDAEWDSSLAEVPAGWAVKSFGGTAPQLMAAPRPLLSASAGEPVVTPVGGTDFPLDLRNERTIYTYSVENFTYSATGWGEEGAGETAAITYTVDGGAPQMLADNLTDDGKVNWNPSAAGTYVFTHTSGGATETATFMVEAAPTTPITLPTGVATHTYVVSNLTGGTKIEMSGVVTDGATYDLPIGAHVAIYCVPAAGYVVSGTNPYDIPSVTDGLTIDPTALPKGVKPGTLARQPLVESGSLRELIGVPWKGLDGEAVKLQDYVVTDDLTVGDKLFVFDKTKKTYDSYELDGEKTWKPVTTLLAKGDAVKGSLAADPATVRLPVGTAVWLERADASKPLTFNGVVVDGPVAFDLEAGYNLISGPGAEPFNLAGITEAAEGDRVILPRYGQEPLVFTREAEGWSFMKNVTTTVGSETVVVPTKETDQSQMTIPAGTGAWYEKAE